VFNDTGMIPAVQSHAQKGFKTAFKRLLPLELDKGR
jgi:hypothetical protein